MKTINLGTKQILTVIKSVEFGVYLNNGDSEERILLPKKQVPEGTKIGDTIEVFIYKDSDDRPIATTAEPYIMMGKPAVLKVAETNKNGAYLDWGLEKDLFLPFREQTRKVKTGEEVLVALYVDKTDRLCTTMNVYKYLRSDSPYVPGDEVTGMVYEDSDNYGLFVAVDNIFSAIIPVKEVFGEIRIGDSVKARVTKVRDDGKLNLSVRDKSYIQMYPDMDKIMNLIDSYNGVLPFTEKASPEVIKRETGMSKSEFKRAVGHLYKQRKIVITDGVIRKNEI